MPELADPGDADLELPLLEEVYRHFRSTGSSPEAQRFRLEHEGSRRVIDGLLSRGRLKVQGGAYALTPSGLVACESSGAKEDVAACDALILSLRDAYRSEPAREWTAKELTERSGRPPRVLARVFHFVAQIVPAIWAARGPVDEQGLPSTIRLWEGILDTPLLGGQNPPSSEAAETEQAILLAVLTHVHRTGAYPAIETFRAAHASSRGVINDLVGRELLKRDTAYVLTPSGLDACDAPEAKQDLVACDTLILALREVYRSAPDKAWTPEELASRTGKSLTELARLLPVVMHMDLPHSIWSGHGPRDANGVPTSITLSENVLDVTVRGYFARKAEIAEEWKRRMALPFPRARVASEEVPETVQDKRVVHAASGADLHRLPDPPADHEPVAQVEYMKEGLLTVLDGGAMPQKEFARLRKLLIGNPVVGGSLPQFLASSQTPGEVCAALALDHGDAQVQRRQLTEAFNKIIGLLESDAVDLANYDNLGPIGHGGFGQVFRFRHRLLRTDFAVKVFAPAFGQWEDGNLERFFREARILVQLNHPAIVRFFDAGMMGRRPYFRMEFVEGTELQKHGRMEPADAVRTVTAVAEALAHAHSKNVIHRDLKPSNIMIGPSGEVRVIDFGQGVFLEGDIISRITRTGQHAVGGLFTAPELLEDPTCRDPASDLYSLGAVWYQLLAGRPPSGSKIDQKLDDETPNLPASHREVVLKCLEDRKRRFSSATELLGVLRELGGNPSAPVRSADAEVVVEVEARPSRADLAAELKAVMDATPAIRSMLELFNREALTVERFLRAASLEDFFRGLGYVCTPATRHEHQYMDCVTGAGDDQLVGARSYEFARAVFVHKTADYFEIRKRLEEALRKHRLTPERFLASDAGSRTADEPPMKISFPRQSVFSVETDSVNFPVTVDGKRLTCRVSTEALQDHFRGDGPATFEANRSAIETVAETKIRAGVLENGQVVLRSSDFGAG